MAALTGDDVILCQITSKAVADEYAIPLTDRDFADGGLKQESNIRPNRLFTADSGVILYRAGKLKADKLKKVITKIVEIVSG